MNLQSLFKPATKQEEQKTEVKTETVVTQNKPVTEQQLRRAWEEYAQRKKDDVAVYHILIRDFTFTSNTITLPLANPIEEPLLQAIRAELLTYLRDNLQNSLIQLVSELKEIELKKRVYTNKDKFDYLVQKNPALKEMKDRFGLDPDF